MFEKLLVVVGCLLATASSQPPTPGPDQCVYQFTVPSSALSAQCMTPELKATLAKVKDDYAAIKKENHDLKEQLNDVVQEYKDMVETVKLLKKETASWRAIVEWPQFDEIFKPDNLSLIMRESPTHKDCTDAVKGTKKAGIYKLEPEPAQRPFFAFCDEEGWIVIFRRFDGEVDFHKDWNGFSGGFGELSGEFWIGLEHLNWITSQGQYELHVEALGWNGKMYTATHESFQVLDEMTDYQLLVGPMSDGNYVDAMSELNGTKFTTFDRDHDEWYNNNCATYYKGGWWLKNCGFDPSRLWCDGGGCISWGEAIIKKIVMKIRDVKNVPKARPVKERRKKKKGGRS